MEYRFNLYFFEDRFATLVSVCSRFSVSLLSCSITATKLGRLLPYSNLEKRVHRGSFTILKAQRNREKNCAMQIRSDKLISVEFILSPVISELSWCLCYYFRALAFGSLRVRKWLEEDEP